MGASGIVEMSQRADEGEACFLGDDFRRHGIAGEAGGVPSHDRQPTPQNRLEGRRVPGLSREDENLVLNSVERSGHCCITVAPE